mmetsp:Transcript_11484/g.10148  ORF Transcript_11484/g.10148 Transcript_11484/m.10148 type:complete len:159 (+) Transcript_11484:49-525(+)
MMLIKLKNNMNYKEQNGLEKNLDLNLSEIKGINRERLDTNKKMSKLQKAELDELTDYFEDKLRMIKQENKKSKNTFKELIVSRETEMVRINKEIDSLRREHDVKINKIKETILEQKEELRISARETKHDKTNVKNTIKLNHKMQKENAIKIRQLRELR